MKVKFRAEELQLSMFDSGDNGIYHGLKDGQNVGYGVDYSW